MTDPRALAASTLQLLQQDPSRYLLFGVYWYFVKALLKRYYKRENLGILGDYFDPEVMAMMPEFDNLQPALDAAIEEYNRNVYLNLNRPEVENPTGGGTFLLIDEDF